MSEFLTVDGGANPFSQVWWDNVRLDARPVAPGAPVPAPGTLGLVAVALAGLGIVTRRLYTGSALVRAAPVA